MWMAECLNVVVFSVGLISINLVIDDMCILCLLFSTVYLTISFCLLLLKLVKFTGQLGRWWYRWSIYHAIESRTIKIRINESLSEVKNVWRCSRYIIWLSDEKYVHSSLRLDRDILADTLVKLQYSTLLWHMFKGVMTAVELMLHSTHESKQTNILLMLNYKHIFLEIYKHQDNDCKGCT